MKESPVTIAKKSFSHQLKNFTFFVGLLIEILCVVAVPFEGMGNQYGSVVYDFYPLLAFLGVITIFTLVIAYLKKSAFFSTVTTLLVMVSISLYLVIPVLLIFPIFFIVVFAQNIIREFKNEFKIETKTEFIFSLIVSSLASILSIAVVLPQLYQLVIHLNEVMHDTGPYFFKYLFILGSLVLLSIYLVSSFLFFVKNRSKFYVKNGFYRALILLPSIIYLLDYIREFPIRL